jgi:hypothetical protein
VANPKKSVDVVRHYDKSVQGHLISEILGSLPFFSDDFAAGAEVHPPAFDGAEKRRSLPRVRGDEVRPAAIVVVVEPAGAGAGRWVDEAFHGAAGFMSGGAAVL